ncbi:MULTISPECIES: intermembrane transport protein PqiB [Larsenimonas]|uniref:Intermembrane transport protein PqiB n=1 Tax=Larsenimonas suaedae TaxID=1851019 RepID=A0ABU1GSF5_9GAMM|nr:MULTISPECIES: intermembrane transport protein PqiB [Larsenimonas]MCM2972702.1 intermembrane transport protein PqiB [Larsenimonas suaedae]MCM5704682.1 intermembrane transport protein PqiB [Larsenimonas salina]MDR5894501.1 intermembrane transport protein PqiB [Larsenimonas suaedae]
MSSSLPQALRKRQKSISPVWLVPLLAVLIGGWMLYHTFTSRGPEITLIMDNAEGIEAGKTLIKARNVEVGRVNSVSLSDDTSHAVVTARMHEDAENLLKTDSRFWVVKPRVGREGISGLNTVLSGPYIQLQPGRAEQTKRRFDMLEKPPVAPPDAGGLRINLTSANANALSVGDPVIFQGFTVGRVEASNFDTSDRQMHYRLYIFKPYRSLVTTNTRFWSASGVRFDLSTEGFTLDLASIESLISGGVTFGVPEDIAPGNPIAQTDNTFELYGDEETARQGSFSHYLKYIVMVDDTVRGLHKGAPVEYRGVRIGTVDTVAYHLIKVEKRSLTNFSIPVLIRIEPQRIQSNLDKQGIEQWRARVNRLVKEGLRASLKAGNLFTGALFVDLNFDDSAEPVDTINQFEGIDILPSQPGSFAQIEQKVSALLDKLNDLQIEPALNHLDQTLASSDALVKELTATSTRLNELLDDPSTRALPSETRQTLESVQGTLDSYSQDTPAYGELTQTLKSLQQLLNDLQPAARTLSEKPNALLFNREVITDPQPKAAP